jgi:hypothetical protein
MNLLFRALRAPSLLLTALVTASLLAAGCSSAGPSAATTEVFEAASFAGGETLAYQVVTAEGEVVGHGTLSAIVEGGQLALRQAYSEADPPEGVTPTSDEATVWVDPSTFLPVGGERVIVRRDGDGTVSTERFEWTYGQQNGAARLFQESDDGEDEPREGELRLREHFYDNESSLWLWRSVDLSEDLDAYYVSVNPIEVSQQTVNVRVPQTEMVTVPAGEFEAYRLLFRNGRAVRSAWIEVAAPHRVLRWDNGDVVLELLPD